MLFLPPLVLAVGAAGVRGLLWASLQSQELSAGPRGAVSGGDEGLMRPDEKALLIAVASRAEGESVRSVVARLQLPQKRAVYLLEKWTDRGWYDYGVTVDMGWLTEKGQAQAREL